MPQCDSSSSQSCAGTEAPEGQAELDGLRSGEGRLLLDSRAEEAHGVHVPRRVSAPVNGDLKVVGD